MPARAGFCGTVTVIVCVPERMRNFLTLSYGAALGGALHQHFAAEPKDASELSEHLAALIENGTEGRRPG